MPAVTFEDGPAPAYSSDLVTHLKAACPHIFLICFRNKNHNVVVYQANVVNGVFQDPPVSCYWLILEPSYQVDRRARGIHHDREELNYVERTVGFSYEATRVSDKECKFAFTNFPQTMTIKIGESGAQLFGVRDGRKYLVRSMYIESPESVNLFNLSDNVKTLYLNALDITAKPFQVTKVYLKGSPQ
jgi:hypothetical protein